MNLRVGVVILVGVCSIIGMAQAAEPSPAVTPAIPAQLTDLFPGRRIRDFAAFDTDLGASFLVLLVRDFIEPPADYDPLDPPSCPTYLEGVPLTGHYSVALVAAGKLINEVTIPPHDSDDRLSLPLRNTIEANYNYWGQGTAPAGSREPLQREMEPTKLIRLADYNGDGLAHEFRIVVFSFGCGHSDGLIVGYSAKQHRVRVYPIIRGASTEYWHDNLFPPPYESGSAILTHRILCRDHGIDSFSESTFAYNPEVEAWVMTYSTNGLCIDQPRQTGPLVTPAATEVRVDWGSSSGKPGDIVEVGLSVSGLRVGAGVEIDQPLPVALRFVDCRAAATTPELWSEVATTSQRLHATFMRIGERDPNDAFDPKPLPANYPLLTCRIEISPAAEPSRYDIVLAGLLVSDGDYRLRATAGDGSVIVGLPLPEPTPTDGRSASP